MMNPAPGFAKHPDHTVRIEPTGRVVNVEISGQVIASTDQAVSLHEANYPPVFYLPLDAIPSNYLVASDHSTYCPFKGKAAYFDLKIGDETHENAVWTYSEPYDEALEIKNYVAFYPDVAMVG